MNVRSAMLPLAPLTLAVIGACSHDLAVINPWQPSAYVYASSGYCTWDVPGGDLEVDNTNEGVQGQKLYEDQCDVVGIYRDSVLLSIRDVPWQGWYFSPTDHAYEYHMLTYEGWACATDLGGWCELWLPYGETLLACVQGRDSTYTWPAVQLIAPLEGETVVFRRKAGPNCDPFNPVPNSVDTWWTVTVTR